MSIKGTVHVACPACGRRREVELVQSINTATDADAKQRLLAGALNVLACDCGKRTQLAANVLFHDPGRDAYYRVVPGDHAEDDEEIEKAAAQFRAAGATGTAMRSARPAGHRARPLGRCRALRAEVCSRSWQTP